MTLALHPNYQRLQDISTIRDAMHQISLESQSVVELLDVRIEDKHLDGSTEVEDVRSILEEEITTGSKQP